MHCGWCHKPLMAAVTFKSNKSEKGNFRLRLSQDWEINQIIPFNFTSYYNCTVCTSVISNIFSVIILQTINIISRDAINSGLPQQSLVPALDHLSRPQCEDEWLASRYAAVKLRTVIQSALSQHKHQPGSGLCRGRDEPSSSKSSLLKHGNMSTPMNDWLTPIRPSIVKPPPRSVSHWIHSSHSEQIHKMSAIH